MRFPKHPPERVEEYLDWIRSLACAHCCESEDDAPYQSGRTEASHHPREGHGSTGRKCSDYRTIPLCQGCHGMHHKIPLERLWVEEQITQRLIEWIGQLTAEGF